MVKANLEKFRNPYNHRMQTCMVGVLFVFFILFVHLFLSYGSGPQQGSFYTNSNPNEASGKEQCLLDINYVEENLLSLDQTNPQLIQYTRVRHLTPPSKLPYHLNEAKNYKDPFSSWVADFFENKRNGIFIEAGAHEGEKGSHTLYLEKELGWTGLLVECNPTVVPYLKSHHRKAWIADVCLAPTNTPGILNFSNPTNWTFSGTFKKPWHLPVPTKWTFFDVATMPFFTVLAALGWTEVDYFSFDIEGMELSILKTFPFDMVIFKVFVVEVMFYTEEEKNELDALLQNNGYHFVKNMEVDKVYVHNSVKHLLKS